jgi:hypothetical protein
VQSEPDSILALRVTFWTGFALLIVGIVGIASSVPLLGELSVFAFFGSLVPFQRYEQILVTRAEARGYQRGLQQLLEDEDEYVQHYVDDGAYQRGLQQLLDDENTTERLEQARKDGRMEGFEAAVDLFDIDRPPGRKSAPTGDDRG